MLKLFSKERALYLVDNPTKWGFSWWFLWTGIAAGYCMHWQYGDSQLIIMVVEKYTFVMACLTFGLPKKWVIDRVRKGAISRDSNLLYLVPPFCYAFTFFSCLWFAHIFLAIIFS